MCLQESQKVFHRNFVSKYKLLFYNYLNINVFNDFQWEVQKKKKICGFTGYQQSSIIVKPIICYRTTSTS